ncbi:uncharacterized protein PGRI_021530 [Penicillium griseofulvum]|uniref:Uncharacterized protein n=1 Tax=Penicillium patulum TaxID=5078 RepID=A0A135LH59_PENPA|nr:uncharacterized protein PGRI_021530 [Penicillium griseofulvum]KXG48283.1 hypothetical protein PGRI_021530 [Penicillium griseofulvum]
MVKTKFPAITAGEDATVNYLLSGVLSGGEICKASELAACLSRWFSDVKEDKPVASAIPELLGRLLLPFGTPTVLERMERSQTPDSFPDRQRWMEKLRVLMDDEAHERLLQKLESLQDQQLSFKTLCEQENEDGINDDNLAADPALHFDYDLRDMMIRGDKKAMRKHQEVFYVTGSIAWTVRSPYWNVALAIDKEEVDSFRLWLASEEKKANDLDKPWPFTPSRANKFKFITPEPYSRLRTLSTSGLSPVESTPNVPNDPNDTIVPHVPIVTHNVQTELLRELLAEVKELKTIVGQILESKQELGTTENQMHGSLEPVYPPISSAMQPNYFLSQGQFVGPQYQLGPDWQQRGSSQNQGPSTLPDPGAGSARRR